MHLQRKLHSWLITGGTGALGRGLIRQLLRRGDLQRIVVLARNEHQHYLLRRQYPAEQFPQLELLLGDVRDAARVRQAAWGVEAIVHAAAQKHIHLAEAQPNESIATNILGTANVIAAAQHHHTPVVVGVSSDKASSPLSLYGATKLCADKLLQAAQNEPGNQTVFATVRLGNLLGARGSVAPHFLHRMAQGLPLQVTDPDMTRYLIEVDASARLLIRVAETASGGELAAPKMPSFRLGDLVEALEPTVPVQVVGLRPGERRHEELICPEQALAGLELDELFVLLPSYRRHEREKLAQLWGARQLPQGFSYVSNQPERLLSVNDLRQALDRYRAQPDLQFDTA